MYKANKQCEVQIQQHSRRQRTVLKTEVIQDPTSPVLPCTCTLRLGSPEVVSPAD